MRFSRMKKWATAGLLAASAAVSHAGVVTSTLSDFSSDLGLWNDWPVTLNVGQFNFSSPGNILSATISGTFGNGYSNTTTETFVYGDGIELAYCSLWDDCSTNGETAPVTAWSYTFTADQLALLQDGRLELTVGKEYLGVVNLGSLTLELVNDVPEPASAALLLAALAGLGWTRRARRPQA
ncbi:PEP-CTERM sorting domain-containing protein [Pseudorhodoferax sp.]|uniref:PEP-CTERM sorting domain-containing protein n=1 Tax=Pseudorhodoferax sp. TaxID=1993553 RepID=UPI002DD69242|nr:PEP-CTERM sorting domain-containing protein [Pseudorhodoferax sp.]